MARDAEVLVLQKRLKEVGLYDGEIDGDFGPKTLAATLKAVEHLPALAPEPEPVVIDVGDDLDWLAPTFALLKEFEGYRSKAYADPAHGWKVPTIGYGTTVYPNGVRVKRGDTCTHEQAVQFAMHDIETIRMPAIKKVIKVDLNTNQLSALISFSYNVGIGALAKSTLAKKINAGVENVTSEFLKWNKAGGKTVAGLTRRRVAEAKLFHS